MPAIIEMQAVTKHYRGVPAISAVDFSVRLGEVHAIVGENGAGKSTLTKIIAGVTFKDGTEVIDVLADRAA